MGIDRSLDRADLCGGTVYLADAPQVPRAEVRRGPRIGVDYAGRWAERPYRFWVSGSPHVSRPRQ
ncbi:MAG: DNA-3-methyladenine glycosylase, partial [Myxococcaceae bacterium]